MAQGKTLGVARMDAIDRVHHGDAHGIHVVGSGADGFAHDQLRVQSAGGNVVVGHARVHGSHDGGAADGIRPLAKAQGVANDSAVLGGDAAEGRDGAGEIVGFTLDGDHPAVVKLHSAGIVLEGRNHQRMIDLRRGLAQPLEQAQAFPGGVVAVVAPALHQDFDFGVGVRAAALDFVRLDGFHLRERGVPGALDRQGLEFLVAEALQRDFRYRIGRAGGLEGFNHFVRFANALHNFVIEKTRGQLAGFSFIKPGELETPAEACEHEAGFSQRVGALQDGRRFRIGHRGPVGNLHHRTLRRV